MTPDERRVLRSRFALGENSRRTVEQVDRQFSVTLDRIRQIEEKALRKLKEGAERQVHSYTFCPVTPDDLPAIAGWLRHPHVARWWSEDPTKQVETIRRHLLEPASRR